MKINNRVLTLALIVLMSIATLSTANQPVNAITRYFSANISPNVVDAHSTSHYTISITNTGAGYIGSLNVTIPTGFNDITVYSLSPSTWTVFQQSQNMISLKPNHPSLTLGPSEVLSISFSAAAPKTAGTYQWTIACTTNTGYGGKQFLTSDGVQPMLTLNFVPLIDLSPNFGQPGALVVINGSGFAAESSISATFDDISILLTGILSTDSTGSFGGASFTVPTNADFGSHIVNVTDGSKAGWEIFSIKTSPTLALTTNTSSLNSDEAVTATAVLGGSTSDTSGIVTYSLYNGSAIIFSDSQTVANATTNPTVYQATYSGSYYFVAQYSGDSKNSPATSNSATITVNHGSALNIIVAPKTPDTITAGSTQAFTAVAYDGYNSWDVTNSSTWSIDTNAYGSWNQATGTYTSQKAGNWKVTAIFENLNDTATLNVTVGPVDHIVISPKTATIDTATAQAYAVEAFDRYSNSLGEVTAVASFNAINAIVNGNSISASSAGDYVVTASYNGKTDSATLTVTAQSPPTPTQTPIPTPEPTSTPTPTPTETPEPTTSPTTSPSPTPSPTPSSSTSTTQTTTQTNGNSAPAKMYTVTFTQQGLPTGKLWIFTFNGETKSSTTSKITFSIKAGSYIWTDRTPIIDAGETRFVLQGANTSSIKVPTTSGVNITYATQYKLTVNSPYGSPTGERWYSDGSQATFSVETLGTDDSGNRYAFTSWTGKGPDSYNGTKASQSIIMNGPVTETANWQIAETSLYTIAESAIILFVLLALLLALLTIRKRKKAKKLQKSA